MKWMVGGACLLVAVLYFVFDPAQQAFFPQCPFRLLTGWECPGCGSQRALHALLHLKLGQAFHYNALLVLSIPFIGYCIYVERRRTSDVQRYVRLNNKVHVTIYTLVIVVWWIGRNIVF